MENNLFITCFRNFSIEGSTGEYFELLPGICLTNDEREMKRLLSNDLRKIIGVIEYDHLKRSDHLVFCRFGDEVFKELESDRILLVLLLWVKSLFRTAWIIKDHCYECDAAFLIRREMQRKQCSSNFLAQRPLLADESIEEIPFKSDELEAWKSLHHRIEVYLHGAKSTEIDFFMEKSYCRSGRALHFVNSARTSTSSPFRIAHSCSALETLFSTDSSELSHKLSERVAFFLGGLGYSKVEVFKNMKAAYNVRSKLTHGDSLSSKLLEGLPQVAGILDGYLRTIFSPFFGDYWAVEHIDVAPGKNRCHFSKHDTRGGKVSHLS